MPAVERPIPLNEPLPHADFNAASAGFFEALRVPLVAGCYIAEADTKDSPKVMVIQPDNGPARIRGRKSDWQAPAVGVPQHPGSVREVVGVAGDVQPDELNHAPTDEVYFAASQNVSSGWSFVAGTQSDPMSYRRAVENAIHAIDKDQPVAQFRPMPQLLADTMGVRRFSTILLGIFPAWEDAVRRPGARSPDACAASAALVAGADRLLFAGAPRVAARSDGGVARGVSLTSIGVSFAS